jgi:EAL domain-containing protein (putative c-di-GMP-specific phosphodiesterase class I)
VVGVQVEPYWHHPELGVIDPEELIRLQEVNRSHLMIDEWIICGALTQFLQWKEQNKQPDWIAVPVAWWQIQSSHFIYKLSQILQELKLPANCLMLMISEESLLTKIVTIEKSLSMLKHMGVRILITDFGVGHLSLQLLKKIPIDYFKIDRSLTDDITHNPENEAVVKMIVAIAKSLQVSVISEGVESLEQKSLLKELGCDTIQGSYFGPVFSSNTANAETELS